MDLSPAWLLSSLCVGSIGTGLCIYGKKQLRLPQFLAGLVLVVDSALVPSTLWMIALAALALAGLWGWLRAGL